MTDEQRAIELEIEVPGTPEQVWEAIATGPGISSWYVPHEVEPREGGAMTASFGPGPEMQIHGRVAAWQPPRRVVFDKGDEGPGLAFEWLVEARDHGVCVVRLVNSGFGSGAEWDDQYDAMTEGWRAFLANLRVHLQHFAGEAAVSAQPMAMWPPASGGGWPVFATALGIDPDAPVGERVVVSAPDAPALTGTIAERLAVGVIVLLDGPAPGTAMLLAESHGPVLGVSVWTYRYGPEARARAAEDADRWGRFLQARTSQSDDSGAGSR